MGDTKRRTHADSMRDYIELLKRDLSDNFESRVTARIQQTGENSTRARHAVRSSNPMRKRRRRLCEAEAHLERHLAGVAYWEGKAEVSTPPEQ